MAPKGLGQSIAPCRQMQSTLGVEVGVQVGQAEVLDATDGGSADQGWDGPGQREGQQRAVSGPRGGDPVCGRGVEGEIKEDAGASGEVSAVGDDVGALGSVEALVEVAAEGLGDEVADDGAIAAGPDAVMVEGGEETCGRLVTLVSTWRYILWSRCEPEGLTEGSLPATRRQAI
jgi:hypothetical protein